MKEDLDYYLTQDHVARQRTMVFSVVAGALAGAIAESAKAPGDAALGVCLLVVAVIELAGAFSYGRVRKDNRRAAMVLPIRRYLLRAAVPAIGILVLSLLRIPNIEAAVVNRRLREITGEDPFPFEKVDELVNFAIQNRIPIPEKSIAAAQQRVLAAAGPAQSPFVPSPASKTFSRLQAYTLYNVADVRLHLSGAILLPSRVFQFYAPVFESSISVVGESRSTSIIDVRFRRTADMAAALDFAPGMQSDALVARLGATGKGLAPAETPEFIRRAQETSAYNVVALELNISNLHQTLDGFIWIDVAFDRCLIAYRGGAIHLQGVRFLNCEFSASDHEGEKLMDYIKSSGSAPVTFIR
jgi:hypothetical protein